MARRLPSLKSLQAFEAYFRCGSMMRAADELCVTHGAISRQIKVLEEQLGISLLRGPKHNLQLTPAADRLATGLVAAFDRIHSSLPGSTDDLIVSAPASFAMKWLIPRLASFMEQQPDVKVRIVERSAREHDVFGLDGAQVAICLHKGQAPAGVKGTPFLDHYFGPVLAPGLYEVLGGDPRTLLSGSRLSSETFLQGWHQWATDEGLELPDATHERIFEHNSYMLEAAAAGLGVAVTAWAFAKADIDGGRLIAPWGFRALPTRFTLLRPTRASHPAAQHFSNWLVKEGRKACLPPAALV
jgi:DNA-binding transcriptional LysR family regulator